MFIKIIRGPHDSMYECDNLRVDPSPNDQHSFILTLQKFGSRGPDQIIKVDKDIPAALGVYIMNNDGKTIDTIFQKGADE